MRRSIAFFVITAASIAALAAWAQEAEPVPRGGLSLAAELEVQKVLLQEDMERFERLAEKRGDLASRLARLYKSLDSAVRNEEEDSLEQLDLLTEQAGELESERANLLATQKNLIDRIRERQRAIELIKEQLNNMPEHQLKAVGPLAGVWDVILMPSQQSGTFTISQTGTLISGTYMLDGGWTGSLQGTFINRKVYMVRIDSKKGRMMELEGYLAADGYSIRGTWLSYEVLGGDGSRGQWSAEKRESEN